MSKTIKEMTEYVHGIAKSHGFWEDTDNLMLSLGANTKVLQSLIIGQKIALIHSELSEALEADRKGIWANKEEYEIGTGITFDDLVEDTNVQNTMFKKYIKDSVEDEIADAAIRIMDLCGYLGIDLEWHIEKKAEYNNSRPYKHDKKY